MISNFANNVFHHPLATIDRTISQQQNHFRRHDHLPVRIRLERRKCVDAALPRREALTAQPIVNRACHRGCRNIRRQHIMLVTNAAIVRKVLRLGEA
jgi:hypothetical protein